MLELEPECAYMINPGSVGQPRGADPRAAYVLYNPQESFLIYYRLPYDVRKAQGKIRRAGLPPLLADSAGYGAVKVAGFTAGPQNRTQVQCFGPLNAIRGVLGQDVV
jgi:hypothetical protein